MKRIWIFLFAQAYHVAIFGQVGIGTSSPNATAQLEIASTSKGLLIPRLTQLQRTSISGPALSLLVYQTDGTPGFYFYDGSSWQRLEPSGNSWSLSGNAGTNSSTDYIGTSDNTPLTLKVNSVLSGYIDATRYQAFFGYGAGATGSGPQNSAFGYKALGALSTAIDNTAVGFNALSANQTGSGNTAVGSSALSTCLSTQGNTAVGFQALQKNGGSYNTSIGYQSSASNVSGGYNTALGYLAMQLGTVGNYSVAVGSGALIGNTGDYNTAVGASAMGINTSGSQNVAIGYNAGPASSNLTNTVAIGYNASVTTINTIQLGNASIAKVITSGCVQASNVVCPSDGRFKYGVRENVKGLDFILRLRPISYFLDQQKLNAFTGQGGESALRPAKDGWGKAVSRRTGFIAQEVVDAAQKAGFDFDGVQAPTTEREIYTLSYSSFVVPLVKAVQEQQQEIYALKKEVRRLRNKVIAVARKHHSL